MRHFPFFILILFSVVISAACIDSQGGTPSSQPYPSHTQTANVPSTWSMKLVWNISTVGIPFMDMAKDGSLSAVIDDHRVHLIKPTGDSVSIDLQGSDAIQPVITGVIVKGGNVYVLGNYEAFSGMRIYSWDGKVGEIRVGSFADCIMRSPDGSHMCHLVTLSPTEQLLTCDGLKTKLESTDYAINAISDTGVVVLRRKLAGEALVTKNGKKLLTLNTPSVIPHDDKLLVSENNTLKILALKGEVLASREKAGFGLTTLLRWTLIPTKRYIFRYEPFGDTHVFTWNLTEVKVLPGFPYFANENFVVTAKGETIRCYSLNDFHEVFNVKVPGDSIGYIRLSDDGKVMLVSGETGNFWLYAEG
ncbi:hypothetical protein [Thermococcus piezophilus]|uniref:hypothetical protein n=1 Tax=Thermococcus piezophilus TaxID=1712654 RepID=UPI000AFC9E19|nr:hypothetical protein [Thermococcus piezophilus]